MTLTLALGVLLAGAVVVAVVRQGVSARKDSRPLELGVRKGTD